MTPGAEIELGPHWWKASALTTRPTLPPNYVVYVINNYVVSSQLLLLYLLHLVLNQSTIDEILINPFVHSLF